MNKNTQGSQVVAIWLCQIQAVIVDTARVDMILVSLALTTGSLGSHRCWFLLLYNFVSVFIN